MNGMPKVKISGPINQVYSSGLPNVQMKNINEAKIIKARKILTS